ncbi:hypothetical protein [Prescottella agglutinans]|uniref:Internal scaffolding protein n=1 Tax=Prescottella agglutinans TaxID=1644129 RepID=A0ABT6MJV3_9NOCA|nr:hypothetical protein [Prescottella agglutinans]MDH6284572.1 hypothetical protein [Prescottella agglutinans]
MRIMSIPVFMTAAERLRIIARQATPGPYQRSKMVPGALRCVDAADGGEQHLAFGIARKEDFRLLVGADPEAFELLASALEQVAASDSAAPALADYVAYLSRKMGLKLPEVDFGAPAAPPAEPAPVAAAAPTQPTVAPAAESAPVAPAPVVPPATPVPAADPAPVIVPPAAEVAPPAAVTASAPAATPAPVFDAADL